MSKDSFFIKKVSVKYLTASLLFTLPLFAQQSEKYDFTAKSDAWVENNSAYIKNGTYILDASDYYWSLKSGIHKNFTVEVTTRYIKGIDNEGYGLVLRKSGDNRYSFYITANGYARFLKYYNNKWNYLTEWVVIDNHNAKGTNSIKVVAQGKLFKCYVNTTEIFSVNDGDIKEGQIGLVINNSLQVAFDDFILETIRVNVSFPPEKYDYSSVSSNWPEGEFAYTKENAYHLNDTTYSWAIKSGTYSDFVMEVNAKWLSGIDNEGYGFIFRKSTKGHYIFYITANGYARFWKRFNEEWKGLTGWIALDNFNSGGTNHLKVDGQGKLFKCFVNNSEVFTINDSDLDEGQVGFVINGNLHVQFNDFTIYPPGSSQSTASNKDFVSASSELNQSDSPALRGSGDPLKGLNVSRPKYLETGNYYALIIGIDKYTGHWTPLTNAVNDAKAIEKTLRSSYRVDTFRTLYNEQATRKNIIRELEWFSRNVTEKDNVLIYYSGHGDYKKEFSKGYWVPHDATTNSTSDFISNADMQVYLTGIKSKHTLLISDACFSGDILRGNTVSLPFENSDKYFLEVFSLPSRQALTSGGIQPVMDGGAEGHSVFAYYFLKTLQNNTGKYLDAGQLYEKIKIPIINNSDQTPQFSSIKNTGDEGGQFIFIRK